MNEIVFVLFCVTSSTLASVFLKIGASTLQNSFDFKMLICSPMVWWGAIFYGFSFVGYFYALKFVPLSLLQPVITACVSTSTVLIAVLFFKEQMSIVNWLGVFFVSFGVCLLFINRVG